MCHSSAKLVSFAHFSRAREAHRLAMTSRVPHWRTSTVHSLHRCTPSRQVTGRSKNNQTINLRFRCQIDRISYSFLQLVPLRRGIFKLVIIKSNFHFSQKIVASESVVVPNRQPQSSRFQLTLTDVVLKTSEQWRASYGKDGSGDFPLRFVPW